MRQQTTRKRSPSRGRIEEPTSIAAKAALDKKAEDLVVLDLRGLVSFADYFVICSGTSKKQVQAIADGILEALKRLRHRPLHIEGYARAEWVLLDYGALVVHVFQNQARDFYDLERLWRDAKPVSVRKTPRRSKRVVGGSSDQKAG